jgi:hypothetical protein
MLPHSQAKKEAKKETLICDYYFSTVYGTCCGCGRDGCMSLWGSRAEEMTMNEAMVMA